MRDVEFLGSFDRSYRKLGSSDRLKVNEAVDELLSSLEAKQIPGGLGLKRLSEHLWEIRVGLSLRVGFRMHKNLIQFGIVGDHENIKKFIRNF